MAVDAGARGELSETRRGTQMARHHAASPEGKARESTPETEPVEASEPTAPCGIGLDGDRGRPSRPDLPTRSTRTRPTRQTRTQRTTTRNPPLRSRRCRTCAWRDRRAGGGAGARRADGLAGLPRLQVYQADEATQAVPAGRPAGRAQPHDDRLGARRGRRAARARLGDRNVLRRFPESRGSRSSRS